MTASGFRPAGLSLRGFSENVVSDSVYQNELWPQIDRAVDLMLDCGSTNAPRISFEETYSAVYRIVCQGYGAVLYDDLIHKKIELYAIHLDSSLQLFKDANVKEYIERFNETLQSFMRGIQSILAVFAYMSRCLLGGQLDKAIYKSLNERLISRHIHMVLEYLSEAEKKPFAVEPSTFASIIKTLYLINTEYADLNPGMFRKFIPGMCSTGVGQLEELSQEAKEMSSNLQTSIATCQRPEASVKRPLEDSEDQTNMDGS